MGIIKKDVTGTTIRCLINSTNIIESKYDTVSKDFVLTFRSGRVYKYKNVDARLYNQFELSESHGKSFHQLFKTIPQTRLGDIDPTALLTEMTIKV